MPLNNVSSKEGGTSNAYKEGVVNLNPEKSLSDAVKGPSSKMPNNFNHNNPAFLDEHDDNTPFYYNF